MRISNNRLTDFSIQKNQFKTVPRTQELLKVRILDSKDCRAHLEYEGRTLTAKIDNKSNRPLQNGETLFMRVLSKNGKTLVLQIADNQKAIEGSKESNIENLLNSFGLKANSTNMMKARLLVACRIAVTEETLKKMNIAIKSACLADNPSSITAAAIHLGFVSPDDTDSLTSTIEIFNKPIEPESLFRDLISELTDFFSRSQLLPKTKQKLTKQFIHRFLNSYIVDIADVIENKSPSNGKNLLAVIIKETSDIINNMALPNAAIAKGTEESSKNLDESASFIKNTIENFIKSKLSHIHCDIKNETGFPFSYFSVPVKFHNQFNNLDVFYFPSETQNGKKSESLNMQHFIFRIDDVELGLMIFDVMSSNNILNIKIDVSKKKTSRLFKKHLQFLKNSLVSAGYTPPDVSVKNESVDIFDRINQFIDRPVQKLDINI